MAEDTEEDKKVVVRIKESDFGKVLIPVDLENEMVIIVEHDEREISL